MIRSILKSLLKSDAYPEPTSSVELLQTHVSYIFLTDLHAYKIKKPVDFGFLNFSTIDRRRFYCNEEVRLNRRLSPDIYLGVVELRETETGASFFGNGTILDYAVKMKRLPAERMLDKLVATGDVSPAKIREIARHIAEFHKLAPTSATIAEHGRLDRIRYNWQESFDQMTPFETSTLPSLDRERISTWVTDFVLDNGQLFQNRVDNGFIRECDGDIHLENICLENGTIHIFDCIEFNDRFRCCDTAADIAFLLMDLDFHGCHDLSDAAQYEYIAATGDHGAVDLIDFYKIYRAFVRGKVESFRLNDTGMTSEERNSAAERAVRYFRLAQGYIMRKQLGQTLLLTCGLMGSGKSELSSQMAFELGLDYLSSDAVRKQLAGVDPEQAVKDPFNQGLYTLQSREITYTELLSRTEKLLESGRSVIVDACFLLEDQRERFASVSKKLSVPCIVLHLDYGLNEIKRRLIERQNRGSANSDGRPELLDQQSVCFERPDLTKTTCISLKDPLPVIDLVNDIYSRILPC